jgi:maleylacetate reductase
MRAFQYTSYPCEVLFGPGSLDDLPGALDRLGRRRLLLCASGSTVRAGIVDRLSASLGEQLIAVYDHVQPHVPEAQVTEALALARERHVDGLIGLGGGSPIGFAKALAHALQNDSARQRSHAIIAVVAIPTTYAGSEMTPVFGVTRQVEGTPRKITVTDPAIVPRVVVYDPVLTLALPRDLTASTAVNALAHCVEALYSITANPLSTAAALEGARLIVDALTRCLAAGDDLSVRSDLLAGAYLAGVALSGVKMGLHHGLCHVLGGTCGVPHGIANAIVLPHALRFNLDATAPALSQLAAALVVAPQSADDTARAIAVAERIDTLIGQLGLPRRLRDVGVPEAEIPALARLALASPAVRANPKPIEDATQIEAILRAAW